MRRGEPTPRMIRLTQRHYDMLCVLASEEERRLARQAGWLIEKAYYARKRKRGKVTPANGAARAGQEPGTEQEGA